MAGAFPLWLAPVQAQLIPIADRHVAYADEVLARLKAAGLRVETGRQRRPHERQDPQGAAGKRSPTCWWSATARPRTGSVAVRLRTNENLGAMAVDDFIARVQALEAARDNANI